MLSHPSEYEGGELYMQVDRSSYKTEQQREIDQSYPPLVIKPNQYSAVVFMADENTHQVLKLNDHPDGNNRQTIGTEFWEYGDAPFGIMRPSPEMWHNYEQRLDFWDFGNDNSVNEREDTSTNSY
jgi:hypothetical protein